MKTIAGGLERILRQLGFPRLLRTSIPWTATHVILVLPYVLKVIFLN